MRKFLVVLMALLFTTGAFAQSSGAKFDYNLWGVGFGAMGSLGSDLKYDYQKIRLVPKFTAESGNIKGVVALQIDQKYGAQDDWDGAEVGSRFYATKVRLAYLQASDVFVPGLGFITGLKDYFYPLIADCEGALTGASFDFGMGTATLFYLKLIEDDPYSKFGVKNDNDAQVYGLDVAIKAGGIEVRPALFYATTGKQNENFIVIDYDTPPNSLGLSKMSAFMGAVNATGDMGMFDFEVTGAFLSLSSKDSQPGFLQAKLDGSAFGFDLGVGVKPAPGIKIGLFGTYTSGTDGSKPEEFGFTQAMNIMFNGWIPVGRLFLIQHGGTQDFGGLYAPGLDTGDYLAAYQGNMAFGISFEYKMDKLTLFAQYGYAMYAEDYNAAGDSVLGSEIDVKVSYEIAPKTDLFLEYAFVMQGDDILLDDAQQILWGIKTSI